MVRKSKAFNLQERFTKWKVLFELLQCGLLADFNFRDLEFDQMTLIFNPGIEIDIIHEVKCILVTAPVKCNQ